MKKILIIVAIIAALFILAALGLYLRFGRTASNESLQTNPFSSGGLISTTTSFSTSNVLLSFNDGSVQHIPSFTKNDQPSWANEHSGLEVAGSETDVYQILYFPTEGSLLVSLLQEPLGDSRLAAEKALKQTLHLTNEQFCSLKYEVSTNAGVNETYGGENLGFSFCPNAVQLPL